MPPAGYLKYEGLPGPNYKGFSIYTIGIFIVPLFLFIAQFFAVIDLASDLAAECRCILKSGRLSLGPSNEERGARL